MGFQKRTDRLPAERRRILDDLGFEWDAKEGYWEKMFLELAAYKDACGDCVVPKDFPQNPKLSTWVGVQRTMEKEGKLPPERRQRLEALGFVWNTKVERWERMFAELIAYKAAHGHCQVPRDWSENKQLGTWVGRQRDWAKNGRLSAERRQRLDALGFVWDPKVAE
jgi:Fe2+ transport system protein FeoA